jgi:hypothetical protein
MAGLLSAAQPQQAQAQSGQRPRNPQQAQYEQLMNMLLQFLYSDQGVQAVKQGLQLGGSPAENIGTIVARLIQKVWMDARQQSKQVPPLMVLQAAIELSQAVTDMAMQAGVVQQNEANRVAKDAFYHAMTLAGQGTKQAMPAQERQQFQKLLQMVSQMDQQASQPAGSREQMQEGMA